MMRGAQSAGLVTYKGQGLPLGIRKRVVNGKRTDLCTLLLKQYAAQLNASAIAAPQLFQGHTRFATSSIAALPGCHPHQWTPARMRTVWRHDRLSGQYSACMGNVEAYITHNGDLDFFELHEVVYTLEEVQQLLIHLLHSPMPASVDSMCVAGLLELLRTAGMWHASVRYGYVYGALACAGNLAVATELLWPAETLERVTAEFEKAWSALVVEADLREATLRAEMERRMHKQLPAIASSGELSESEAAALIQSAVGAFFEQDLLAAGRKLLKFAMGSFGLVLSTSLDAQRELVIGSRGQTMSIAFYPMLGAFLFGSESAACKAGVGVTSEEPSGTSGKKVRVSLDMSTIAAKYGVEPGFEEGFRFDMDDVNGEMVLLRWGVAEQTPPLAPVPSEEDPKPMTMVMRYANGENALYAANFLEGGGRTNVAFMARTLRLGSNPFVLPLPSMGLDDPVGRDISEIPTILRKIVDDWNEPAQSLNRLSAYTLLRTLKHMMIEKDDSLQGLTRDCDLLITGCEVSLWCAEQFASDLHNAFPRLKIVCISANKLLGQLGQAFPTPQIGFSFNENSYDLHNTVALLVTHSGGTFATLNVSNLLKGFTSKIFTVTAEWDTQVGRAVRDKLNSSGMEFGSYIFTNFCGVRPAEPCSLTVAATHQLLTQILIYLMYGMKYYEPERKKIGGSKYHVREVEELEALNMTTLVNVERICSKGGGEPVHPARTALVAQGRRWADHILEGPRSWLLCTWYILITVGVGYTPLSAITLAIIYAATGTWGWGAAFSCDPHADPIKYIVGIIDAAIYAFLPWWTTIVIRLLQGRPWHHRVASRSLLIGDVPWVAQSLEAFTSKLFALSYSIATVSVSSGNPLDHLVHRHTHRVVRGALLAVGRPDGRANALTSSENTVCLSVNQASSIQNMGVTLESITLGHNPFKLGLSANAIFLPDTRKQWFSEFVLSGKGSMTRGASAAWTMGALSHKEMKNKATSFDQGVTGEALPAELLRDNPQASLATFKAIAYEHVFEQRHLGQWMATHEEMHNFSAAQWMERQGSLQELYEGRMASLERFVGFLVLFHAMGKKVQDWWPAASLGLLGYDMSRTHSIMRIATTASPVSGSDVRHKILEIASEAKREHAEKLVLSMMKQYCWKQYRWKVRSNRSTPSLDRSNHNTSPEDMRC
eukprot:CAMPEP_0119334028 /NCGR_PEP_ID=MMETSP1333-20130426/86522_1 /TAXON_ID=418940 /ORGANISM="Scyphosphaera apsteinii, Strain RCC1455" /LENGTH=1168 /DNA_ID=CAMNT_0007344241 /DNA_START=113 /DNA_END=3619 /DNA_ORIENTATION=+